MATSPTTWRSRLRRWRWWLIAILVVIAVRVALPFVLRRVIASQASEALHARVDVGDVRLALWKGAVALEDIAVRSADAPAPPSATTDQPQAAFPDNAPIIAFKRLAVELRYLPLFSKTIQLRNIELDTPRVALDRLASGHLNVMALVPSSEVAVQPGATPGAESTATPTVTPGTTPAQSGAPASPWKIGLDRFVLNDGRLRFRDLKLAGSEPVEVGIDQVVVQDIALSPGLYGQPAQMHVKVGIDSGTIDVTAGLSLLDKGYAATVNLNAAGLPLRRARLYVPKVGWSDLKGALDLALTYELETDTKNALHGTLALHDVAVTVPKLQGVAVGWKGLDVNIDTVDLLAQRAAITSVALDGASISVRAQGDQPLPALAEAAAADDSEAKPTPPAEPVKDEPAPAEPSKPWEWSVADVRVSDSMVHVLSDQPPLDVGVDLAATALASAADSVSHVALGFAIGGGSLKLDGDLRLAPPGFGGTIQISDLAVPPLLAASGRVDPALLPSATVKADLAVQAGLPAKSGAPVEPDLLRVTGTLGIGDARVAPPGQADLSVAAKALDLTITDLAVPGVIPIGQKAADGAAVRLAADLALQEPHVSRGGESALSFDAQSVHLGLSGVSVPASLAGLAPAGAAQPLEVAAVDLALEQPHLSQAGESALSFDSQSVRLGLSGVSVPALLAGGAATDGAQPLHVAANLDIAAPKVALGGADLAAGAGAVKLAVSEATITAVPPGASAAGAPPAHVVAQLGLTDSQVAIAGGKQLAAGAQAIGLQVADLSLPGLVIGAPPNDNGQPVHAAATLTLTQAHAQRADGKEFSAAAKSIVVPATDLSVPGIFAATADLTQPLRAVCGEIHLDAPALRITRTKDGIVLPVAASSSPAAAPGKPPAAKPSPAPAGRPLDVTVAALRLTGGAVDFTDRAVQPVFQARYAPIEVDARNIHFPNPSVKPVRVDITTADQGHITLAGDFGPQGGTLEFKMNDFALAPFNPYATTYSPYGISDGSLEIKTEAKYSGGKYDVTNAVTLHQLDLSGAEGDSMFEQQFGIPLTLALALMRDTSGDIDLSVPVQVDQSGGTSIDLLGIMRSALRQAMTGAIESPLKLVGGVIGLGGGKSGSIAPAPIAFPLGRTTPTNAGAESAQRLADFLASRPAMAVALDTAITTDDVRWLREQALHSEWQDEGFFQRSLAFVTHRGPRERIGDYLRARADGQSPQLSPDDAALLQQWLDARPAPSADQLQALAAGRLTAVQSVLRDKGIDQTRITLGTAGAEPAEGAPVVKIKFRPLGGKLAASGASSNPAEEGQ